MTQWVKKHATKPENLILIPRTLTEVVLLPPHMNTGTCATKHIHIPPSNGFKNPNKGRNDQKQPSSQRLHFHYQMSHQSALYLRHLSQFISHILKTPSTPTLPHMATACLQRMLICCQTKLLPYVHDSSPPAFASFVLQLEFNSEAAAVTGSNWGKGEPGERVPRAEETQRCYIAY